MARQFDVCVRCQQCVSLCGVFPLAFDQILSTSDGDAGQCTPFQQDEVVDACTFCGECTTNCIHGEPPTSVGIMALNERMQAMRFRAGLIGGPQLLNRVTRRVPNGLARRADRLCLDGAYDDGERIGCCGAGARFAGDLDAAAAARRDLASVASQRDLNVASLRFGDPRCRCDAAN